MAALHRTKGKYLYSRSMEEKSWCRSTSNLYIFQLHSITMFLTNTSLDQLMVATLLYRLCEPIFQLNWVTVTILYYERPSSLSMDTHIIVMIGLVQLYILSVVSVSAGLVFLCDQKSSGMFSSCHPVLNILAESLPTETMLEMKQQLYQHTNTAGC